MATALSTSGLRLVAGIGKPSFFAGASVTPIDVLAARVARVHGTNASAIALITGYAAYVRAHAGNPAMLLAYANEIDAKAAVMGQAVVT